jgi:cellulose synthase/poly-beta-1,6-N-acetylglucosamine synthase-like glycosyltransferase
MQAIKKYSSTFASFIGDLLLWIVALFVKIILTVIVGVWNHFAMTAALVFLYFKMYDGAILMFILAFYFALTNLSDAYKAKGGK